jgi:hypothetical protein
MHKVLGLFNSYIENNLILEPGEKYVDKAFNIVLEAGITIYDSLYMSLAINKKTLLLTLDRKQRDTALRLGIRTLPWSKTRIPLRSNQIYPCLLKQKTFLIKTSREEITSKSMGDSR